MRTFSTKLAVRKLLKQKSFTLVNLVGLAISLAASIIILVYASYEISFDKHIPDYGRTYRIVSRLGDGKYWARSFACYPEALANRPEIEDLTSFLQITNNVVQIGASEFTIQESIIADTAFQDFFGLELISGRKEDLGLPNTVFLTAKLAENLFPEGNAQGKEIFLKQVEDFGNDSLGYFIVAGIIEPLPENTHFGFQMIFSQKGNFADLINHQKAGKFFAANVYLRLFDPGSVKKLEADMTEVLHPFLSKSHGPSVEAFNSRLQPLKEIHFTTGLNREPRPVIRLSVLYLLYSVGGLVFLLLCMNFLSSAIVQSLKQRKEIGIMRTLGAGFFGLYRISLAKVSFIVGTALLFSWIIILVASPILDVFFGSGWDPWKLIYRILFFSCISGIFVVFVAASGMHFSGSLRSVVDLLKGEKTSGKKLVGILGVLTIVQFGIVVFLIGFSMMIGKQLRFMNDKDLGYTSENIYVMRIPSRNPRGSLLLEEIRKQASVIAASTVHHHPGDVFQHMGFAVGQDQYPFEFRMVDHDVFQTLDIELIRKYLPEGRGMIGSWVINEAFYNRLLQDFSEEDIAGSKFNIMEDHVGDNTRTRFTIAGVMSDFHYSSLHDDIGSFAYVIRDPVSLYNRWLMVRFHDGQSEECIAAVNDMMQFHFPGRSLDGFLLSDNLSGKYSSSRKLSEIILAFTLLAVIIAGLGLHGLSLYITQQRIKEIGIRKVFGAGSWQIISMLNFGFIKWVAVSICIASPLTLWAIRKWLTNFAFKAPPSIWIFILAGIIVAGIAIVSVTWQTASAAGRNPVDSIRHE
jgi:putative ABC transport system permease protein